MSEKIKSCFGDCPELYGSTCLCVKLKSEGTQVSRTTTAKYMRALGLRSKFYQKFRKTTDSKHNNPVAENLLDQVFKVEQSNKVWVSDITHISVMVGFEHLTTVIDLFDRKVVGYIQSRTLRAKETVIPAFEMAIWRRMIGTRASGFVCQSDRWGQYTCKDFVALLTKAGVVWSNYRKGDCWPTEKILLL